jgi:hypothetical protein
MAITQINLDKQVKGSFSQTGLAVKGASANALTIKPNETLSAPRTLNVKVNDADKTIDLAGNLTTSGANNITLTTTGATNVTLPTTGTIPTLTGTETLTNKTLTSPTVTTSLTTGSSSFDLLNANATTINAFGAATDIDIGANGCLTKLKGGLYLGDSSPAERTDVGLAGTMITWNSSGGLGETDIVNYRQGGVGGFIFKIRAFDGTVLNTPLSLDSSGNGTFLGQVNATDVNLESSSLPAIKFKESGFDDVAGILFQTSGTGDSNYLALTGSASNVDPSSQTIGFTVTQSGKCLAVQPTAGLGYGPGAGGTVTQATSKTTAVTINKVTGVITMNNASMGANTTVIFTVNNSTVNSGDTVQVSTGGGFSSDYRATACSVTSGSFKISLANIGTTQSEALTINFTVLRGASS